MDGHVIGQSMAIARYVAKLTGLYGKNAIEQAKYDDIVDACQDFFNLWAKWTFEKDEKAKVNKMIFH